MSSEGLHVAREKLSRRTLDMHYAITSLIEELEAVDWYRQRADDCDDPELKKILLHNAKERSSTRPWPSSGCVATTRSSTTS